MYCIHLFDTLIVNRVRIPSNCVELIFGKGHLSTFRASKDAVFLDSSFLSNVLTLRVFFSDLLLVFLHICSLYVCDTSYMTV